MYAYILKRIFLMIPTLVGVITIFFFISEFVPGGPYDQVVAMIRGTDQHQGEVAMGGGPASDDHKKQGITIDPKEEQRIKRVYGLNQPRWERYLRTLLWFKHDSITSSLEVDTHSAQRVSVGRKKYFVVCQGTDTAPTFDVFLNAYVEAKADAVVFHYDFERNSLQNILSGAVQDSVALDENGAPKGYNPIDLNFRPNEQLIVCGNYRFDLTGQCLSDSSVHLIKIPSHTHYEVIPDIKIMPDGSKLKSDVGRWEVYLDQTPWESLTDWDNWHGFFLLKFPDSIRYKKPAYEVIMMKLPVSVRLGVITFFLTYMVCIFLGIAKAVRNGTSFDAITSVIILVGYSIPGFVLAVFLLKCFGPGEPLIANLIPLSGIHSAGSVYEMMSPLQRFWDNVWHMCAPILCFSIGTFAMLTFLTKNSVLEHTTKLYAVAARARGLSERRVLYKHILRNSLIPLVTGFPSSFLMMFFGGSLLIEKIFNLDGVGLLGFTALVSSDFPLLMSNLFMFTFIGLTAQLLTDICYVFVDPRISFEGGR